jgi:hypothetical protein
MDVGFPSVNPTYGDDRSRWISKTWIVPLASRRFWLIRLLELHYPRSHFSISPTGAWRVVRCEILINANSVPGIGKPFRARGCGKVCQGKQLQL